MPFKKLIFGAHFGGYRGSGPPKISFEKITLQLNDFTQKLDFDALWFRRKKAYKI